MAEAALSSGDLSHTPLPPPPSPITPALLPPLLPRPRSLQTAASEAEAKKRGVAGSLAVAEAALSSGDLLMAAEVVEGAVRGTAAEAAAAAWVRSVRERAAADQALRLLRAHAMVLAASLA